VCPSSGKKMVRHEGGEGRQRACRQEGGAKKGESKSGKGGEEGGEACTNIKPRKSSGAPSALPKKKMEEGDIREG